MAPVVEVTGEMLTTRRNEILSDLGLETYVEFRNRAASAILTDAEWGARDELDALSYLLGDDELTD